MDLETMMREAGGAPPQGVPHAAILQRARRRRMRRRASLGVAAVAVLAVVVGVAMPRPRSVDFRPVAPGVERATQDPALPAEWKRVSFHGLEISVPARWGLNATRCGEPVRDTLIIQAGQGGTPACATSHRPGLTVARLGLTAGSRDEWVEVAQEPTEVSGHPALVGVGKVELAREPRTVLVVPDVGVVLSVTLGDRRLAERIIDSARVVETDSNGCDADVGSVTASGDHAPEKGLVPEAPTAASLCRYVDGRVARSVPLGPALATSLANAFNGLQPVAGPPVDRSCASDGAGRGFVVHFRYADAPDVDVAAFVDECRLRVDNGIRSGWIDSVVLRALVDAAGYDAGLSEAVVKGEPPNGSGISKYISMRMESDVVSVGSTPVAIVENRAPIAVRTGLGFRLERRTVTGWRTVNSKQGFRAVMTIIEAARNDPFEVAVYINSPRAVPLQPGRYRVSKTIQDVGQEVDVSAEFTVVEP